MLEIEFKGENFILYKKYKNLLENLENEFHSTFLMKKEGEIKFQFYRDFD